MKKVLIGLLVATAIGAVLIIIGIAINIIIVPFGLVLYLVASGIAGFTSGTKLTSFFNWQASSFGTGCLLVPVYILVYPVVGAVICLGGWIFAVKRLSDLSKS